MKKSGYVMRTGKLGLALCASVSLGGCFLSPGTFDASLDLRRDGAFAFHYDGQIYMLAMDDLSELAAKADPRPCTDDAGKTRPCSAEELEDQRQDRQRQAEMMKAMIGGKDGQGDPAQLVAHLERQAGWHAVEYLGDGMFDVDFSVSGRLTYDFAFPTIEGFPGGGGFVTASLRDERRVRIEAPGFSPAGSVPFGGAFAGLMAMGASDAGEADNPLANRPTPEGTFRIVTDAGILANNTDEGPTPAGGDTILQWQIGPQTGAPPTALLQLD